MASGKLSPRQKMINMMYLVLTALLALNVSKEILDSFVTVNNGLETTKGTLKEKVDGTYKTFAQYANENKEKYGAAYAQAQQVQTMATAIIKEIDAIKSEIIMQTEGVKADKVTNGDTIINLKYVAAKDNQEAITHVMIGSDETKPKDGEHSAVALRKQLEAFRDKITSIAGDKNPTLVANVTKMFDFPVEKEGGSTGVETSWEVKNFYHVPMAAGITILSKIQTDVRNAENEAINHMLGSVEQKSFKFNTLTPIVRPLTSYVTVGSKYTADIFLGAYDNQNAPTVEIAKNGATVDTVNMKINGESETLPIENAMAKLNIDAGGAGVRTVNGIITFKPVGGEIQKFPFTTTYEVAAPTLVVSPTKMNVFYRGVDNPVDISVAGYSAKDIAPSMTNGSLSKAAQGYVVKPGKDPKAMVSVSVTNPDGSKKSMPGVEFRVKNVPNPAPYFGGKTISDATIKKTELTAAAGVLAKMENFEFDLKFEVIEYQVSANLSGNFVTETVKGAGVNGTVTQMFAKVKSGQKVFIENIKAKGPDGTIRAIGTLSLKVI